MRSVNQKKRGKAGEFGTNAKFSWGEEEKGTKGIEEGRNDVHHGIKK